MKRFIFVLVLVLLVTVPSDAVTTRPANIAGAWVAEFFTDYSSEEPRGVTDADPLPVQVLGGIATASLYTGTLATNAVTLVSSIASLTVNDIVEFQFAASAFRGPSGIASAALQAGGIEVIAGGDWVYRFGGADFGLIASTTATAKYRMIRYKDR